MDMQKIKSIAYPNGKQIISIKDADDKVLWSAGGAVEVDDLWIGDGESVFFSKRTQPLAQAIVRGGCHISVDNPTPDNIGTIVCNNGEVSMSNEGVISVSGSPSYFDLNESRYNLPNLFGGLGVQDEYNMLTGVITRNAQVYALRGSMDWVEQSIEGQSYFALPTASYKVIISTHFHQVGTNTPANVGEFVERNGYYVFNYDGVNDNIADFEDYLDECYAAGEAVLVVGARFVSITEQDDAFDLQQINGRNEVKLFVNDEYSTIALKYKALYPPNNEIWAETTDGTKPIYEVARDALDNNLTATTEDTPSIYGTAFKTTYNGEVAKCIGYFLRAKIKRVWFPQSVIQLGSNVNFNNSDKNMTNAYFVPKKLTDAAVTYSGGNLFYERLNENIRSYILWLGSATTSFNYTSTDKSPNVKMLYSLGGNGFYVASYNIYTRNVAVYNTKKLNFNQFTDAKAADCRFQAFYFNADYLAAQKTATPKIAHHFFPFPTAWIL